MFWKSQVAQSWSDRTSGYCNPHLPATARYAVIRPLRASRFYSLSFNTRDFRTIHGSRPACGSSSLTSSLRNKKAPGLGRGLAHTAGLSLPADLEAGSATRAAANGAASTVTIGDHLDPKRILVLEVRGVAGLAQRIQAVLRRTRRCGGESRQLEDHPRAAIHFRQGEGHGWPFGGHLDLGTGSYVARGLGVLPAIAAEDDWRLSSGTGTASGSSAGTCGRTRTTRTTGNCAGASNSVSRGRCAWTGTSATSAATAAKSQASDIALAYRSVPGGLDLTGHCIGCDAVVGAVVEENVGVGHTAHRAVLVVDHRGLPGHTIQIVVVLLTLHRWEIHWFGVDEFRVLDGVFGTDTGARIHQVRERSRLASGVVLEIPEGDIHHVMTVVVVLVAADREIRHFGLRQAAAVSLLRVSPGVADVLGFAHEQRVHDL